MDFKLSDEEKLLGETAGQFVKRELLTREAEYLRQQELFLPPGDPPRRKLNPALRQPLTQIAKRIGLWALEFPEAAGGSAMSNVARVLIHREFGRTILPFHPPVLPALLAKSKHVKALVDGELSLALAFDQVHKTGAPHDVSARFRPVADGFVFSRTDIEVQEPGADLFLFPAREDGTERIGVFLMERDTPGLEIRGEADLTNDAAVGRMTLIDGKAPPDQLMGYEYEFGAMVASEQLRIAAISLGIGIRCLANSLDYARHRETFGRPLATRQAVQWMLADLSIALRTSTWLTLEAAWRADQELPYFEAAALAKKQAAKMAFEAADVAVQIHGGYGVCKEFPFEGFYREARMLRLLYGREGEMDRATGEQYIKGSLR